ncbi:alpha/beta hydrolase [Thermus sp.]|uniref:alpha/beta hydrolase n=1 Tax=Thermus sp. TaxID=275 RepID=UPI0026072940|nr:alpha/beta hydrolase [Thermus sp.]MCX7848864.1 alpha/beta hydrolase [Thermus sp.]
MRFRYRVEGGQEPLTLLLLHGTGGDETSLLPLARALRPQAHLLSPRGQSVEEGVPRFFRRLGEGVLDLEDLQRRARELAEFVEHSLHAHALPRPLVAVGYSNGANMALGLLFHHPSLLDGALLLRPMEPFGAPYPPLPGKPILVLAGLRDPLVPQEAFQALLGRLQEAGARVQAHLLPTGHALVQGEMALAQAWLEEEVSSQSGAA